MTIDIHPHVISSDTQRYPNAPVGGRSRFVCEDFG